MKEEIPGSGKSQVCPKCQIPEPGGKDMIVNPLIRSQAPIMHHII